MIITDKVSVKIAYVNLQYYLSLGYNCSHGQTIEVKVLDLKPSSYEIVECSCDKCDNREQTSIRYYYKNFNNGLAFTCKGCNYKERIQKRLETVIALDLNGDSIISKATAKGHQTKLNNGTYAKSAIKMAKTRSEVIDGISSYQRTFRSESFKKKRRSTMVERELWIDTKDLPEFKLYRNIVTNLTRKQELSQLKDIEKRSRDFHLDHKFSIFEGFRRGILPQFIAQLSNLQMLSAKENTTKGFKCSVKEDSLFV